MEEYDVVIVGYGPTGQSAASLLAAGGHRVAVFERWPTLYGLPRLCSIDGESQRIVQAAGDVDAALAVSSDILRYKLVDGAGDTLLAVEWDARGRVCGYYDCVSMYQPDIEDAIDAGARERGAEIHQGWEVKGLEADDDGVTLTMARTRRGFEGRDVEGPRSVRAKYVIGADGARSAVRAAVGADREDLGFRDAFLSVDVRRLRPFDIPDDESVTVCDPHRNVSTIPIGPDRIRFEFLVNPDDDNTELLTPDVGYEFLEATWGLTPDDVEIYRQVIYPFEGKIANRWRHGRVLLAGDAAHLMPPFAGQGACSGMRDAMNLSWKLDLVLRGVAGEALLDSYQAERRPHVWKITKRAIELGTVACLRDPDEAAARDALFRSGGAPPIEALPLMDTGILHRDAAGELALPAGQLIPQGTVTVGDRTGRFDDVVGRGFVLLGRGRDPLAGLGDEHRALLERLGVVAVAIGDGDGAVADLDGVYSGFFDAYRVEFVLVRPDFSVFGGAADPAALPTLVDDLLAQLGVGAPAGTMA